MGVLLAVFPPRGTRQPFVISALHTPDPQMINRGVTILHAKMD
jgi:hypothetical protein